MPKKPLPDPIQNFKLTKRAQGTLEKEDISDIVKKKIGKPEICVFTFRFSKKERKILEDITAEINTLISFKPVCMTDVLRALIYMGSELSKDKLLIALRNLY